MLCADDSYGSYKTRETRELGKYKRTTSDSSLLRSHQESKSFRPVPDLDCNSVAENTPSKPPRKKLELGVDSPGSGRRANSPSMHSSDERLTNQRSAPQVPMFQPAEVSSVQHANKYVAKPLQGLHVQKLNSPNMSSSSGSFVDTVVQRPAMNQAEKNTQDSADDNRPSVKDRVKNIEVFSQSPGSSKSRSGHNGESNKSYTEDKNHSNAQPDSLELLESSVSRNDSLRDRLRPVVKKVEPERTEEVTASLSSPVPSSHRPSADIADSVKTTPPIVPNRTYKHHQPPPSSSTYRRESFQNRGPKPFENKANTGANIHSPIGQNSCINNYKSGPAGDPKRSPGQSMPEPQVPSRTHKPHWNSHHNEQHSRDQNTNISSHESRHANYGDENVQNKENTQVHSVQSGQKRNYERSFARSRHSSGGSSNNSVSSDQQNVATNYHNWHPANTHSDKSGAGHSHRPENRGDNRLSHDPRSPQSQSRYNQPRSSRTHPSEEHHSTSSNPNTPPSSNQSAASFKSNQPIEMKQDPNKITRSLSQSENQQQAPTNLVTANHGRQPSAEELECDLKAQELAKALKDSEKELCQVLNTDSKKNRMQYLDGILPVESERVEERRPRSGTKTETKSEEQEKEKDNEPTSPMPSNYYVSPPKAMIELEIRKLSDSNQLTSDIGDNDTLAQKKEELLQRMIKKVDVLKDDKKELLIDIDENESLGKLVSGYVDAKCRNSQEKDKYRSYIDDIDKIIRLLLKLSGLLARAENTIQGLDDNANEKMKKLTYEKRDRLCQQHEDAKVLKMDIDKRSEQLEDILKECLSSSELEDYHYYIKMKSKYTIQLQELEDKITLGNEQIMALEKSMPGKK